MSLTLSGIGANQQSQNVQNASARLVAVLAQLSSGNRINEASDDVAALSTASELQSSTSTLKQASGNIVQAESLAQVAAGGVTEIQGLLGQLQSLAAESGSPVLNNQNRKDLNQQFQQLSSQITALANGTTFNGKNLLNGDLSGDNALSLDNVLGASGSGETLSIGDLSAGSLFGQSLDISTADGAQTALNAIGNAVDNVTGVGANIGAFQQALDFAAANVDSAIANQEAAQAQLSDTDVAAASTQGALDSVQQNASIAAAAQGNRLTPALLQLIG